MAAGLPSDLMAISLSNGPNPSAGTEYFVVQTGLTFTIHGLQPVTLVRGVNPIWEHTDE